MTLTPYANKAPAVKTMLEALAPHKTGCATCGKPTGNAKDFRDDLSMQEYTISRMCQVCQDKVFEVADEAAYYHSGRASNPARASGAAEVKLDRLTNHWRNGCE